MISYPLDAAWEVARWEANYARLPPHQQALMKHLPAKYAAAREAMQHNAFFIKSMMCIYQEDSCSAPPHLAPANAAAAEWAVDHPRTSPEDSDKVRYVFKNLMRDWSAAGAAERDDSYGRICRELKSVLGPARLDNPQRVLVPGCGLARLCCDIAAMGYAAQGNEFSYYLLLASSFILNHVTRVEQFTLHPWVHANCNHVTDADQLQAVTIPDTPACSLVSGPDLLSMCAGDFTEVYADPDFRAYFSAVATCFFIDTAHNILDYIQIIWDVLEEGGYWVNLGPLLYHWADGPEMSIELSLEDVKVAAQAVGFRILRQEMVDAAYMADSRSMLKSSYRCTFWTMVKDTSSRQTQEAAAGTAGK